MAPIIESTLSSSMSYLNTAARNYFDPDELAEWRKLLDELARLQRIEAAARAFVEIELELDASQSHGEDITTEQHNDKVDKWNELCDALIEYKKAEE